MSDQETQPQIQVVKLSPAYWRMSFDIPPLNIFGPGTIPQLRDIVSTMETDEDLKVVVFDSAVDLTLRTYYDFVADPEDSKFPVGKTGLQPLAELLVRINRAPAVPIACMRGRATGVGSELALTSDMRFASTEKAVLSHAASNRARPRAGSASGRR
jgi:enoyl-CoA hydratase/carnithine racemase